GYGWPDRQLHSPLVHFTVVVKRKVLFTDESKIEIYGSNRRVYVIWGCFAYPELDTCTSYRIKGSVGQYSYSQKCQNQPSMFSQGYHELSMKN
uniref:Uncharacterized protein n=1 Tax=Seriola dumerili TaxID=41447 RepID=A0A3B4UCV7_SERDU